MVQEQEGQSGAGTGAAEAQGGASLDVATLEREAVAASPQGVAEAPQFDLSTIEGIRRASEANPMLKAWREEGFEAGRQRREAELRRDQGTVERAQAYHRSYVQRLAAGEDPEVLARETPLYVKANEDTARAELMRSLVQQAITLADEPGGAMLRTLAEEIEGKPEELQRVAQATLETALARARQEAIDNLDPETLPKDHKLRRWLDDQKQHEVETELNAREIAAKQPVNAPRTPSGTPSADGLITAEEFVGMTKSSQEKYIDSLSQEQVETLLAKVYESAS